MDALQERVTSPKRAFVEAFLATDEPVPVPTPGKLEDDASRTGPTGG